MATATQTRKLKVVPSPEATQKPRGFQAMDVGKLMQAKLDGSGITAATARKAGLRPLSGADIAKLPVLKHGAGIFIPYMDMNGKDTGYWHLRYLPEGPKVDGKEQRYATPRGAMPRAYFPTGLDWAAIAKDPKVPIIVTEGEFKALCAAQRGLPVLALGGVNSYRSARRYTDFLPELDAIDWRRRSVAILYDNDLNEKAEVQAAQLQMAEELTKRGALPRLGFFPPQGMEKVGLDDFIVAVEERGEDARKAVQRVVAEADPYRLAERLWQMNNEVAFLKLPTSYAPTPTEPQERPVLWELSDFKQQYENRKITVPRAVIKNTKPKITLVAEDIDALWRAWPHRREVAALTFAPGDPRFVEDKLNIWSGWGEDGKLEPKRNPKVEAAWKQLTGYLFPQEDRRRWFESYVAFKVQKPKSKAHHAVVLYSDKEGVGKDLVCEVIKQVYGVHAAKITEAQLTSEFNSWLAAKMFLWATEVTGSDGYTHIDKVKGYVTSKSDAINEKNQPRYEINNLANFVFLTNRENAFKIGRHDRRFAIHHVETLVGEDKYRACAEVLQGEGGAAALFHYFLHLDTGDYSPKSRAPEWDKRLAYRAGLSTHEEWVADLADAAQDRNPDDPSQDGLGGFLGGKLPAGKDLGTVAEIIGWYQSVNNHREIKGNTLSRALRQHFQMVGKGVKVWLPSLSQSYPLVILRNPDKWSKATGKQAADHWDSFQKRKTPGKHAR